MKKLRKQTKNISTGNIPPPVGFQIMPASGSGSTNVSSMRPTYSFLAVNQDDINERIAADQDTWRKNNPTAESCRYPGLDLYGTGSRLGARNCEAEAGCTGGRVWVPSSSQCECPDGYFGRTKTSACEQMKMANEGGPCSIM
jgi:hypothetical protein